MAPVNLKTTPADTVLPDASSGDPNLLSIFSSNPLILWGVFLTACVLLTALAYGAVLLRRRARKSPPKDVEGGVVVGAGKSSGEVFSAGLKSLVSFPKATPSTLNIQDAKVATEVDIKGTLEPSDSETIRNVLANGPIAWKPYVLKKEQFDGRDSSSSDDSAASETDITDGIEKKASDSAPLVDAIVPVVPSMIRITTCPFRRVPDPNFHDDIPLSPVVTKYDPRMDHLRVPKVNRFGRAVLPDKRRSYRFSITAKDHVLGISAGGKRNAVNRCNESRPLSVIVPPQRSTETPTKVGKQLIYASSSGAKLKPAGRHGQNRPLAIVPPAKESKTIQANKADTVKNVLRRALHFG
ncbi:hypothetical protein EIP91_009891 [Steccherinum ochraceum]|uniref:Uncharacterized protein n=1 Tax=Steccherinum ochraceum TaxID=92696 RepID=A0A4R0RR77_9APHY|nr:hypothetical protein EIP91_009891 [Steccherinum ochraceum]